MNQARKTLMVATDLSRFSGYAVQRAQLLAQQQAARIEVVHCIPSSLLQTFKEGFLTGFEQSRQALLTHQTKQLNRTTRNLLHTKTIEHVTTQLLEGDPDDVLPQHANTIGADLVLIGAHGKGFVKSLLIGSIASRLIRTSQHPTLVIKTPASQPYTNILVGVDFSPASLKAIAMAQSVAPTAHLILAHTFDVPFAGMLRYAGVKSNEVSRFRHEAQEHSQEQLLNLAKLAGLDHHQYTTVSIEGSGAKALLDLQKTFETDLIVVGKHGRHLTQELLIGSVTQAILARSKSDVLVTVDERLPTAT